MARRRCTGLLLLTLILCGCSQKEDEPKQKPDPRPAIDLTGAERGEGGFPTIGFVPPAALEEGVPLESLDAGHPVRSPGGTIDPDREAKGYFRIFPTLDQEFRSAPLMPAYGTLVLRDGCLRLASGKGKPEPLVVFSRGMAPHVDAEGYLVIADPEAYSSAPLRIGEGVTFRSSREATDEALVESVHEACGADPVVWVNRPRSYYGVKLNDIARNAPRVAEIRGVSLDEAKRHMLSDLRSEEAARRQCALRPGPDCDGSVKRPPGSWLMVLPPPPPEF